MTLVQRRAPALFCAPIRSVWEYVTPVCNGRGTGGGQTQKVVVLAVQQEREDGFPGKFAKKDFLSLKNLSSYLLCMRPLRNCIHEF